MRKFYLIIILFLGLQNLYAQNGSDCGLYLTTSFESQCLYGLEKEHLLDDDVCFQACQGAHVVYKAHGIANVASYHWEIVGQSSSQSYSNAIAIGWADDGEYGSIYVEALDANGNVLCSLNKCIEIKSKVQAGITSMPVANEVYQGESVLDVCLGQTVEFFDDSYSDPETPITGYIWELYNGYSQHEIVTTQNFTYTFEEQGDYKLRHQVINECGCKNSYYYRIHVQERPSLGLACYGTTCANTQQTYILENGNCDQYMWEITGGTLVDFHAPELRIQWGNPASGMGTIRLAGEHCNGLCHGDTYIDIPIITDNVAITGGADELCVDELVIFDLPIWAATQYNWHITPSNGAVILQSATPNKLAVQFYHTGNYTISADYINEVLPDCGVHHSLERHISVKPNLKIEGESVVCSGNAVTFNTNTSQPVYWKIYDSNNNVVEGSSVYQSVLGFVFENAGTYKVKAKKESVFCNIAEFIVSVKPSPSSLSIANISGSSNVCPFSTYIYETTANPPSNQIIWECEVAMPSSFTGNEYSASFDEEIQPIYVKQKDPITGCISQPIEYPIHQFQLEEMDAEIPSEVCANGTFHLEFASQEGVTYEWSIIPSNAASILGDVPDGNSHDIQVNNINLNQFNVKIKRYYCSEFVDEAYIPIQVIPVPEPEISYPSEVCQATDVTVNIDNFQSGTYTLVYNNQNFTPVGASHSITFPVNDAGNFVFEVKFQSNMGCNTVSTMGYGYANAVPNVSIGNYISEEGSTYLTVSQQGSANETLTYEWGHTTENMATVLYDGSGYYTCTVTNSDGCSKNLHITIPGSPLPVPSTAFNLLLNDDGCGHVQLDASNDATSNVSWSGLGQNNSNYSLSGQYNAIIDIDFLHSGFYTIDANYWGNNSEYFAAHKNIIVPLIIRFGLEKNCSTNGQIQLIVHDESNFIDGTTFSSEYLTLNGNIVNSPMLLNENTVYTLTMHKTYSFHDPTTGDVLTGTCSKSQVIEVPAQVHANFTIQGGNEFCEDAEVHFLNQSTGDVRKSHWTFQDGADLLYTGLADGVRAFPDDNDYLITLQVEDEMGCTSQVQKDVTINPNYFKVIGIGVESNNKVCEGSNRDVKLVAGSNDFSDPYQTTDHYQWLPEGGSWTNITNNTLHYTNDYQVYAHNNWGCQWTSPYRNIGFLPTPEAEIEGLNEICQRETIELKGDMGDSYTYHWVLSSPQGNIYTYEEANISHYMNTVGTWNATLTVSYTQGNTTCSNQVTHSIVVHPKGSAPSLAWGDNKCLFSGAVDLVSNSGSVYWSNGQVGQHAQYFAPGFITAYQINEYGCKSILKQKYIAPAPDMHFVLSGCYEVCREFFLPNPSIYSFITSNNSNWTWSISQNAISGGLSTYANLPLLYWGEYNLGVNYSNNPSCHAYSDALILKQAKYCESHGIYFRLKTLRCLVEDCKLVYKYYGYIINQNNQDIEINGVTSNQVDILDLNSSNVVAAQSEGYIDITFHPYQTNINPYVFDVQVHIGNTDMVAQLNIDTDSLDVPKDCFKNMDDCKTPKLIKLSQDPLIYHFEIPYMSNMETFDLLSNVGSIIEYNYNPNNGMIEGLINFAQSLSGNLTEEDVLCFEINACDGYRILTCQSCIPLLEVLRYQNNKVKPLENSKANREEEYTSSELFLVPNPAKEQVKIEGLDINMLESIRLLDTKGTELYKGKEQNLKLENYPPSLYIVVVRYTTGEVDYLKLIVK